MFPTTPPRYSCRSSIAIFSKGCPKLLLWRQREQHSSPKVTTIGPGSGKTRVLLWRALNLLVFHGIKPEEIFLSTSTEKAALQLQEGLRGLLASVTERTGAYFDLSKMYIGTLHSLCQRLTVDRTFSPDRRRKTAPTLLDELDQYLYLSDDRTWKDLVSGVGWEKNAVRAINGFFDSRRSRSMSRHIAASNCIALFNRFSEECLDPIKIRSNAVNRTLRRLIDFYGEYRKSLQDAEPPRTDFALLQQAALKTLDDLDRQAGRNRSGEIFKHVLIDEYQDTNTIQEKLIFRLSACHKHVCVVGDDDQALYWFRGATVENFVEFPERCRRHLGVEPRVIPLDTNYRSRRRIVSFYSSFITHSSCDWRKMEGPNPSTEFPRNWLLTGRVRTFL